MKVEKAIEILKNIVNDYDRTPNDGDEALKTLEEEIKVLNTRIEEDLE